MLDALQPKKSATMNPLNINMAIAILLGTVLLLSAIPKLNRPKSFVLTVYEYRILPKPLARAVGITLPAVELLAGLLLICGVAIRFASLVAALLFLCFILAIAINLRRGRRIACGCFGAKNEGSISWGLVYRDAVLLVASLALVVRGDSWLGSDIWSVARLLEPVFHGTASYIVFAICGTICISFLSRSVSLVTRKKAIRQAGSLTT